MPCFILVMSRLVIYCWWYLTCINIIRTLSQASKMSCIDTSFSSHSFISCSKGLMNGEPRIVWALIMWSSSNTWISSIDDRMEIP